MKKSLFLVAALVLALTSCQKGESILPEVSSNQFLVSTRSGGSDDASNTSSSSSSSDDSSNSNSADDSNNSSSSSSSDDSSTSTSTSTSSTNIVLTPTQRATIEAVIKAKYTGYKIKEAEQELEHGVVFYKVTIVLGKDKIKLMFNTAWKFVGEKI